jgi:hypothetical protein
MPARNPPTTRPRRFYVARLRFPEAVRSLIIGYVWDSTGRVGMICKSQQEDLTKST